MAASRHSYFESINDITSEVPGCMNWEANRRESYINYRPSPGDNQNIFDLAKDGFYYDGLCLKCSFCSSVWGAGDQPLNEYRWHRPDCAIVNEYEPPSPLGPNIPIPVTDFTLPYGIQEVGSVEQESCSEACYYVNSPVPGMGINWRLPINRPSLEDPSVRHYRFCQQRQSCRYPNFCHWEKREKSYRHFPNHLQSLKDKVWRHGFYFTGNGDLAVCHCCGLGISQWKPQDDPKSLHAIFRGTCYFHRLMASQTFQDRMQAHLRYFGS